MAVGQGDDYSHGRERSENTFVNDCHVALVHVRIIGRSGNRARV